jgi:phosphopantetheinyl transferase
MSWSPLPDQYSFFGNDIVECIFIQSDSSRCAILRNLLSMASGIPKEGIRLTVDAYGKPVAPGLGIHFNMSHSAGALLIALCRSAQVGIDLKADQTIEDVADQAAFPRPNEQAAILTAADPSRAFLSCWTRKEAVLKATGQGLIASLSGFQVTGDPCLPDGADWSLFDCSTHAGWIGAVAVMAPVRARFWTVSGDRYFSKLESSSNA